MKLYIRFDNQDDYDLFLSMISRVFRKIEVKKNRIGKYSYEITLNDPIKVGRPKVEVTTSQVDQITTLYKQGRSINSISNELHISRRQIYRILEENKILSK